MNDLYSTLNPLFTAESQNIHIPPPRLGAGLSEGAGLGAGLLKPTSTGAHTTAAAAGGVEQGNDLISALLNRTTQLRQTMIASSSATQGLRFAS